VVSSFIEYYSECLPAVNIFLTTCFILQQLCGLILLFIWLVGHSCRRSATILYQMQSQACFRTLCWFSCAFLSASKRNL